MASLRSVIMTMAACLMLAGPAEPTNEPRHSARFAGQRQIRGDDEAAASLANIGNYALGIAAVVVGAVVGVSILANLMPTFSSSVGNISDNFTTADWGDSTANSLSPVFAMVVALGGLFAIIGLAFAAYKMKGR